MFYEIQSEEFSSEYISIFWDAVVKNCSKEITILFDMETATIIAKSTKKFTNYYGVKLNSYNLMIEWDKLSDSGISEEKFENTIRQKVNLIIKKIKEQKPEDVIIISESTSW